MRFLLSDALQHAVRTSDVVGRAAEVDTMLDELGRTPAIRPARDPLRATTTVALTRRGNGLLLTLLDDRERPVQMFPIDADTLGYNLDIYEATITHLADPEASMHALETLDHGKRVAHNEAAEALQTLVAPVLELDLEAARRLFSLVYTLLRRL